MEYCLIDSNDYKFMIGNEDETLNEEESEEIMQPTFISETEMPEIQKNENRNESQNNIELYKEFDCYKLFNFNFFPNDSKNINFLARKKNRAKRTKIDINIEKNIKERNFNYIKQTAKVNFFNEKYENNFFQIYNFDIINNNNEIRMSQFFQK